MELPEGLSFLQPGWWLVHAVTVLFVWSWAYRQGRADERRAQRIRDLEQGKR
jgi:hypothetical protein